MTETITAAVEAISYDHFVSEPRGGELAQSSRVQTITNMVGMLDVAAGERVLEIGTGSGYSAALLSRLVVSGGHVTSLDIDAPARGPGAPAP